MRTITCKISERLDAELEAVARGKGISKSEVVRQAIEARVQTEKNGALLSAHDVLSAGCGIVKGGARDRSWNRKRMKGFGRD
jgi:hypothetical protein